MPLQVTKLMQLLIIIDQKSVTAKINRRYMRLQIGVYRYIYVFKLFVNFASLSIIMKFCNVIGGAIVCDNVI